MHRTLPAVALCVLAACAAGTPQPEPKPVPETPPVATIATDADPPGRNAAASPFAPTPLTDLAKALTSLAVTVLDGNPPPPGPLPIEPFKPGKRLVSSSEKLPRGSDLEFFLFGIQMYAILNEGRDPNIAAGSPGPPPEPEDGALRITALVGSTGLRVVDLDPRSSRRSQRIPGWLAGSLQATNEIVDTLRRGRIGSLLLTEADRPVFHDDKLFERAMMEAPKPERMREAEEVVKKYPRALGVEVDDLYLVARDKRDATGEFFYAFEFNVDEEDGQLVLDSSPLFSVEKRDTKVHADPDSPSPPPPPPPPPPPRPSR